MEAVVLVDDVKVVPMRARVDEEEREEVWEIVLLRKDKMDPMTREGGRFESRRWCRFLLGLFGPRKVEEVGVVVFSDD